MLRYMPFIPFFYACLIIFFSVGGFPHTTLSASKSEIEQFLSLRHELIKTSKTEFFENKSSGFASIDIHVFSDCHDLLGISFVKRRLRQRIYDTYIYLFFRLSYFIINIFSYISSQFYAVRYSHILYNYYFLILRRNIFSYLLQLISSHFYAVRFSHLFHN